MPDHAVPLRTNGDPLVSSPAAADGGAHALRAPRPTHDEQDAGGELPDTGDALLTNNRVLVTAPRHRIEKRTPFLFVIEGIWS